MIHEVAQKSFLCLFFFRIAVSSADDTIQTNTEKRRRSYRCIFDSNEAVEERMKSKTTSIKTEGERDVSQHFRGIEKEQNTKRTENIIKTAKKNTT